MIKKEEVFMQLKRNSYHPEKIKEIAEGSNHFVFSVTTKDGEDLIVKYPSVRETELQIGEKNVDTMFGGRLSLEREAYLMDLVRSAGLPSPFVLGIHDSSDKPFIVVSRSPGLSLQDHLKTTGDSRKCFVDSMKYLGHDLSLLHRLSFKGFGDIIDEDTITPGNDNFAERYRWINDRILERCKVKGCLTGKELEQVSTFFNNKLDDYHHRLNIEQSPATLVITDLHGRNFFIDETGHPSGYFDVESSQAAPAEFELYCLRFFVFNFYDNATFNLAEDAFWEGYGARPSEDVSRLIDFFSACRLLEIFQSYWGVKDGIRDTWGQQIKKLLFDYMKTEQVYYSKLGELWRQRDGNPESPLSA